MKNKNRVCKNNIVTERVLYQPTVRAKWQSTHLKRADGVGFRRFPRQNDAVRSDLPDHVQTDGVLRSDKAQVFPVVTLKGNVAFVLHVRLLEDDEYHLAR